MSVLVNKRGEQKLEVITKALALAEYTIKICKNETNFPKRDRWILTSKITNLALDIVTAIRKANDVRVTIREDYLYRRQLQIEASGSCEAMLTLIEIAYKTLGLESHRVEHWAGLILELETLLSKWRKSDRKRFGELLK